MRSRIRVCAATIVLMAPVWFATPGLAQGANADLLIRGGTIFDGSEGNKGYIGDVAIAGDKILYVGPHAIVTARRVIDAKGMIVAPGFVDTHTHPSTASGDRNFVTEPDPQARQLRGWLTQGASTIVVGVDGAGIPEVRNLFDQVKRQGFGPNIVAFVGYRPIRERVIGEVDRVPNATELATEKDLVAKGMCEGATGFSTGLFYFPQSFAKTGEIIELAKEASLRGGVYDTHQRDESTYSVGLIASVKEALRIGEEADMPVHIGHIKALGSEVWGKSAEVIQLIEQSRARGRKITLDQYPFPALQTGLEAALVPRWAMDGGYPALIKRFNDSTVMPKIQAEMRENLRRQNGPHTIFFSQRGKPWTGKYLDEVAKEWKIDPVDAAIRILRQTDKQSIIGFDMSEGDIARFMKQPYTMTGSDGVDGHPRQYATFPTKYQEYVRKKHVISMGQFIRSSTGLSADYLSLDRRGYLKPGFYADVVVFDPKTYVARANYFDWDKLSEGVVALSINGKLAVDNGKLTVALSGRPLPHAPTPGSCR
jgi:N-acyl-D-aspartate/D-glutamate deacylase